MHHVVEARSLGNKHIFVKFDDGLESVLDMKPELWGPVFEPLKGDAEFDRVFVSDYGAVSWPCGADLDPDEMYNRAVREGFSTVPV